MKGGCHRSRFDLVCLQTLSCKEVLTQCVHTLCAAHNYSIQTVWLTISKSQLLYWKQKNRKCVQDLKRKGNFRILRSLSEDGPFRNLHGGLKARLEGED